MRAAPAAPTQAIFSPQKPSKNGAVRPGTAKRVGQQITVNLPVRAPGPIGPLGCLATCHVGPSLDARSAARRLRAQGIQSKNASGLKFELGFTSAFPARGLH